MSCIATKNHAGQALIELLIIVPTLLILFVCAVPMAARGIFPTWIDERLAFAQLTVNAGPESGYVARSHENQFPVYPDEKSIIDNRREEKVGVLPGSLPGFLPSWMVHYELEMRLQKEELLPAGRMADRTDTTEFIQRSLSLLSILPFDEQGISEQVKKWSMIGVLGQKDRVFTKLGIELFHIDIDAIPTKEPGGS